MVAIRALEERPVVGGEKFSAVIGPSRAFRRLTATALAACLGTVAAGALATPGGVPGPPVLATAALLLSVSLVSAGISGGPERVVLEGGVVSHRRSGALRDRVRVVPLPDIRGVDVPGARGPLPRGVRLVTAHGSVTIGGRLSAPEARWLADAIRRHLLAGSAGGRAGGGEPRPHSTRPGESLVRARSRR
jgi:hypothetical protein